MKRYISFILALVFMLLLTSCGTTTSQENDSTLAVGDTDGTATDSSSVKVAIEVRDFGTMTFELYPDIAPITVENFVQYVEEGFYDGLTFHRVYKDFMIQAGDPDGTGTGGGDHPAITGEFSSNGIENTLSHKRGVISMARSSAMDSATSQFFICHADSDFLDGNYAAFGMLIDGFDVLDAIANVEVTTNPITGEKTYPVTSVVIEKAYVVE